MLQGAPPKVIWVRLGNCRTADVEVLLRARHGDIEAFVVDEQAALLVLARTA
jgi:predicted nuclease of predicted toxin-antitoxin system